MANERSSRVWMQILLVLLLVVPLLFLLVLPGGGWLTGELWFWMILLLCIWMVWMMAAPMQIEEAEETGPRMVPEAEQPEVVRELMNVRVATEEAGILVFRGRLRQPAGTVYGRLRQAFSAETVPLVQQDEQLGTAIVLMPKPVEQATMERPVRPWLHWLLFGMTFLTTTWAGALHQGVNLLQEPERFTVGLPYAIGLLLILGVHELGHYFTARWHGMQVTPPYFIPVPFALGTFGAFIQMKSPPENRRALFDVAVAGPLAEAVSGRGAGVWVRSAAQPARVRRLARVAGHGIKPIACRPVGRRTHGPHHVR